MRKWQQMMAVGVAMAAWATPAWAGGWCSNNEPCKSPTDTCNGNYCVPTAKLCTGDSACAAWEKCDFTCPGGSIGGGSGGTTVSVDAGSSGGSSGSADASTPVWTDAVSSSDGGESIPPAPDAGSVPAQDVMYNTPDMTIPQSNCPASPGVCVAVLSKVPEQAACVDFCKALVPCNLAFTSSTSSSSGGSSGSGGGGVPPQPADAGETDPSYPDAGFAGSDQAPDAGQADASIPQYDVNMPEYDGGPIDPGPDAQAQCVAMCSLWVVDHVADTELAAIEQCVATQAAISCASIEKNCETQAKAFMAAAEANDAWSIGLYGMGGGSTTASDGSTKGGGDAATGSFNGADGGSTAPQSESAATGGGSSSSSGCTAGATSSAPTGLAMLGLLAGALILRRRQQA